MLESARLQWEEAARLIATERDPKRRDALLDLAESVRAELRRRVGQHFELAELGREYARAEEWAREVVAEAAPPKGRAGIRDAALVTDAAFAGFARGASDYRP